MSEPEKVVVKYVDLSSGQVFDDAATGLKFRNWEKEDEEKKKAYEANNKNPPFIQLTKGISPAVISNVANESAVAVQVLMYFFENMNSGNVIMVSQKEIATQVNKSRQAISSAIKVLEKNGAIALGKIGNTHIYLVNPHLAWQKANVLRNKAIMDGTFILGRDENEKLFKDFDDIHKTTSLTRKGATIKVIKDKDIRSESLPDILYKVKNEKLNAEKEQRLLDEAQKLYDEFEENSAEREDVPPWEQEEEEL